MKDTKKNYLRLSIIAFVVLFLIMSGPFYVINEGEQAVVTRFGQFVATRSQAGLYVRVPVIDTVTLYPSKTLSLDGDPARIPTKENQFIIVDTTSRWRISDPAKFYQSLRTISEANKKLSDIIDSSTRTIITRNRLSEIVRSSNIINERSSSTQTADNDEIAAILSLVNEDTQNEVVFKGRAKLCEEMLAEARQKISEYGIALIDIVPRQIKYSDELTESVYSRMIKERNQVAQAYRSLGEGQKAEWLGKLENEKRTIESEAYRISEETKGKADAEAAAIYNEAYSQDPSFYAFWKSLESYKQTMNGLDTTLSTNMDYFKYLYSPEGKR